MRNSYRRSSTGRRALALATLAAALALALDFASGGLVRTAARDGAVPLWSGASAAVSAVFESGVFSNRRALVAENAALEEKLARLETRAALVGAIEEDARALRALVGLAEAEEGIGAPVISSLASSPYGTFVIGAGARDGVSTGDLVLAAARGGFVVGRVGETGARSSIVVQAFAPGASLKAVLAGASVSLAGRGGGNARAIVPAELAVAPGDVAFAPEFGGRAVGVVGAVSSATGASKEVYLRAPMNLSTLRFVYVVRLDA